MRKQVKISAKAQEKLEKLFIYLLENWSYRVKQDFIKKLDAFIHQIQLNPEQFEESKVKSGLRRCVVTRQTTIYYTFDDINIYIVAVFDTRQNPNKLSREV